MRACVRASRPVRRVPRPASVLCGVGPRVASLALAEPVMTRLKLSEVVAQCEAEWDSHESDTSSDENEGPERARAGAPAAASASAPAAAGQQLPGELQRYLDENGLGVSDELKRSLVDLVGQQEKGDAPRITELAAAEVAVLRGGEQLSVLLLHGLWSSSGWFLDALIGRKHDMPVPHKDESRKLAQAVWKGVAVERRNFDHAGDARAVASCQEAIASGRFHAVVVVDLSASEIVGAFETYLGGLLQEFARKGGAVAFTSSEGQLLPPTLNRWRRECARTRAFCFILCHEQTSGSFASIPIRTRDHALARHH